MKIACKSHYFLVMALDCLYGMYVTGLYGMYVTARYAKA